ncbi:GxxExxY protein [candidate division KSB1 bacterium]|nr:GxxExxY protein [candidate division KSB1 bacterium]
MKDYSENELSKILIDCAMKVHRALGPGLLESAHEACLVYELKKYTELLVEQQKPLPLIYEEVNLDVGYRVDILVNRTLIVEIKSADALNDVHLAQLLTYLRLANCRLGLLINFNVQLLKHGIKRVANNL